MSGYDITDSQQAVEALRRTSEDLRIVTECMAASVTRCSRDYKYLWVSKPYADWIRRPVNEIVGRPILEIVGPEAFERLRPHFEAVLSGQTVRYEETVPFHGIGPRWINAVYTPTFDVDGAPDGWVAVVIDLTDRKRIVESLREGEARLAAELEATTRLHDLSTRLLSADNLAAALDDVLQNAIATCGADFGNIQLYNAHIDALEIVAQRGFQHDFLDYFRTVRLDERSACAQAMQSGARIVIEDVNLDASYERHLPVAAAAGYRAVQSTPLKGSTGAILGMLSTHFRRPHRPSQRDERLLDLYARHAADLIERLRSNEALRQSEQRFTRFMLHLPGLAWIKDLEGRYIYANDAALKAFRCTHEQIYGKTDAEIFPPQTAAQFQQNDRDALKSEAGVQVVETLEHEDGVVHHSVVSKFPILGTDEKPALVGGMAIDITDRKRAQDALIEADRRKDEFLATLAHELRNPLAPLCNGLEIIRLAPGDQKVVEQACSMMERQLQYFVRLVDDLLDLSRISRGKIELHKERVALADVINSALEICDPQIRRSDHQLTVALPNKPIYVDADKTRLAQVLCNLLANAAKFSNRGSRIWVTAEQQGGDAVVSVKDAGVGIPSHLLSAIFEMFAQVDHSLEKSQGGLGIGLWLVKQLVELHGGSVEARSDGPGLGSEFIVRLPVVASLPRGQKNGDIGDRTLPTAKTGRRILVVDDNADIVKSLTTMLSLLGNEVRSAVDGLEAVTAAATFRPELILLDLGMPRLNGYDACRRIREQPGGKDMLIVAVTGWGQEGDFRRSRDAGFDQHLIKPIALDALQKLLSDLNAEIA